jgi:hypothetical protein
MPGCWDREFVLINQRDEQVQFGRIGLMAATRRTALR